MHVLVVDPNIAFATLLSEELARQGYGVDACTSGSEALAIAQRLAPDLAVLDMALTEPDALELGRVLRELHPALKLMLIPLMGEQLSAEARSLSIQGILPKPFFLPELPERIATALGVTPGDNGGEPAPEQASRNAQAKPGGREAPRAVAWSVAAQLELEARPVPARPPAAPSPKRSSTPSATSALSSPESGFSLLAFKGNRERIEAVMYELSQEITADAVLLTYDQGLLTWVGELEQDEAELISQAVVSGWRTSAEVARILGREQVRFEQSIAGGNYMLYALGVDTLAILAVAVRGTAPLGLLRHRARTAADTIARLCSD